MMLQAGLVGARFIHFTCTIVLFGGALFGLYSGLPGIGSERLVRLLPAALFAAAIGSFLSGLVRFFFAVGNMKHFTENHRPERAPGEFGFGSDGDVPGQARR